MTIDIVFIAGRRDSACRNDAYSVVQKRDADDLPRVLDILPAYELGRCRPATLKAAFKKSMAAVGDCDLSLLRRTVREELRLRGFPVTPR